MHGAPPTARIYVLRLSKVRVDTPKVPSGKFMFVGNLGVQNLQQGVQLHCAIEYWRSRHQNNALSSPSDLQQGLGPLSIWVLDVVTFVTNHKLVRFAMESLESL